MTLSIPLITCNQQNIYSISKEAEEALKSFGEEQLAVISIIGKPKTGKSYILNHIASNPQAFQVNSNVSKSTKGVQMSMKLYSLDGKKVLLLDNQSYNSSLNSTYQSKLFYINMLLSSVLIYNNFGVIDEQALSHLSLIIGLGQMSELQWNIQKPCLLWLVRDFILKLETTSGKPCTAVQYLEKILDEQKGVSQSITQKNCTRTMIKEIFSKRQCETMVRPAKQQKDLHSLSRIPFQDLRAEFLKDVQRLKLKLSKCLKYKKVNGQSLTGNFVLKLVKACVCSFNSQTQIPSFNGIWNMIQAEQKRDLQQILDEIASQLTSEYQIGKIVSIQNSWNDKIKSLNTHGRSELMNIVKQRKQQLFDTLASSKDNLIPITFQDINLDFLESIVHKNYKLDQNQTSKNKGEIKLQLTRNNKQIQFESQLTMDLEKELEQTKQQLILVQQKCKVFEKQRQSIIKTIQNKDKYIENITSRKKDSSILLSKADEEESNVVAKLLEMYQKLQEKYERINNMSKNTLAYICSHCKMKFDPYEFEKHVQDLKQDISKSQEKTPQTPISNKRQIQTTETQHQPKASFFTPYIVIPQGILSIDIEKTLIKQDQQHRNYIEYIIKVCLKDSKWIINRKYKDFCELHDILMIMLPELQFPDSSALIKVGTLTSVSNNMNKKNIVQQRRKTLQNYLTEIIDIDEVRNTRILQKFLKVNQQYKQQQCFQQSHHKSKSPFSYQQKSENKYANQRSSIYSQQSRKYTNRK